MKLPLRILLGIATGIAVFWIGRFAGWVNSLTTQRTPFYWTLNNIGCWVLAVVAFIAVLIYPD